MRIAPLSNLLPFLLLLCGGAAQADSIPQPIIDKIKAAPITKDLRIYAENPFHAPEIFRVTNLTMNGNSSLWFPKQRNNGYYVLDIRNLYIQGTTTPVPPIQNLITYLRTVSPAEKQLCHDGQGGANGDARHPNGGNGRDVKKKGSATSPKVRPYVVYIIVEKISVTGGTPGHKAWGVNFAGNSGVDGHQGCRGGDGGRGANAGSYNLAGNSGIPGRGGVGGDGGPGQDGAQVKWFFPAETAPMIDTAEVQIDGGKPGNPGEGGFCGPTGRAGLGGFGKAPGKVLSCRRPHRNRRGIREASGNPGLETRTQGDFSDIFP
jgi:hypothetical protein